MLKKSISIGKASVQSAFGQIIAVVVVITFVGMAEYVGLTTPIINVTEAGVSPVFRLADRVIVAVEFPFYALSESFYVHRKLQDLEIRYSEALARISQLKGLEEENKALKELIENTDRKDRNVLISIPIISRARPAISAGSKSGVTSGDQVLVARTLVGIVESVSPNFSNIRLLSQSDQFPIVVKLENDVEGIVIGDGRRVILTEVTPEADLAVGQKVVTAGQPGVDRDIFIGIVSQVIRDDSSPIQEAIIDQVIDFNQARVVEVYLNSDQVSSSGGGK